MLMSEYSPDQVVILVGDHLVEGLLDGDFLEISRNKIEVRLMGASPSAYFLSELEGEDVDFTVRVPYKGQIVKEHFHSNFGVADHTFRGFGTLRGAWRMSTEGFFFTATVKNHFEEFEHTAEFRED